MVYETGKQSMAWMEAGYSLLKRYILSMEDKMAAGAFVRPWDCGCDDFSAFLEKILSILLCTAVRLQLTLLTMFWFACPKLKVLSQKKVSCSLTPRKTASLPGKGLAVSHAQLWKGVLLLREVIGTLSREGKLLREQRRDTKTQLGHQSYKSVPTYQMYIIYTL